MADDILSLNRSDFNATLRELADQGMDTTFLRQKYREKNSPFSGLLDYANRQQQRIDDAGRRPIMGGLLSKPVDATGMDAITQAEFEPAAFISGLLSGGAQAVEAPAAAMRGDLTRDEAEQAALGTAGMAFLGAGANVIADKMARSGGSVGDAAARSYLLGHRLAPESGYTGPSGKPSTVGMPDGARYDAKPINSIEQAARDYMRSVGMDSRAFDEFPEFSEERARLIAVAYDMMPNDPSNALVRRSYDAMIDETMGQYKALKDSGIEFKFLREGMSDPYAASPALGYQDLVENGRLFVYPTDFGFGSDAAFDPSTNPLLKAVGRVGDKGDAVANDAFRAVHDAFGHFGFGNPFFRRQGEERAFLEHSRMYSPEARGAMTSETRGQNSWVNSGPFGMQNRTASGANTVFADQKAGLMPSWTSEVRGMPDPNERAMLERYMRDQGWNR